MRSLTRLEVPPVLERLGQNWTRRFLESGNDRPPSAQYGHIEIRNFLNSSSNHKCFYCERLLKNLPTEVDHYIEVNERKHLSFLWENLYLSCENCNNKKSNRVIPCTSTLDPCYHSDDEIAQHLTFEEEIITNKNDSEMGDLTIKKYNLDSPVLDHVRLQHLNKFKDVVIKIREKQIDENRRELTEEERSLLTSFASKRKPFSLMMMILLRRIGLIA